MVYIPGITKPLVRRKGGGKGSKGKGGGAKTTKVPKSTSNLPLGKTSATSYGNGGGPVSTIPSGLFAGRTAGGGSRANIFGNRFGHATLLTSGALAHFRTIMEQQEIWERLSRLSHRSSWVWIPVLLLAFGVRWDVPVRCALHTLR